ncbi:MAG: flagellar biosynthesis protein FliQ [Alphaproteobacteria bacterium]|jgi:flagellar biosynthetic protein FliQ|nr:flagellar biosynthesis protein FliQ [Alphaproteobacteria bacterium]
MNQAEVIDIARESLVVILWIGAPVMLIALAVGLAISLVQALTQIQEMTLTFVPKILVIFVSLIFLMPFMLNTLIAFTQGLFDRMITPGF